MRIYLGARASRPQVLRRLAAESQAGETPAVPGSGAVEESLRVAWECLG